jgi:hypothetical protein
MDRLLPWKAAQSGSASRVVRAVVLVACSRHCIPFVVPSGGVGNQSNVLELQSIGELHVPAKAGPMPTDERLGDDLQGRWKPSIQLDEEQAIVVREPDAAVHLTPQHRQLTSERRILSFKPALRLEWRGQDGQNKKYQRDHCALTARRAVGEGVKSCPRAGCGRSTSPGSIVIP